MRVTSKIKEIIDSIKAEKVTVGYSARCPFHKEKTPSFVMSLKKGFYHCFGCQLHGTLDELYEKLKQEGKLK